MEEATSLMLQRSQTETKQRLLEAFNTHFLISEADVDILTSTGEPVDDDFFRLLQRVKKVHQDSQLLLGTENQRLGLEILEQRSKQLNAAFQKLYRWVQREFKTLDLENPQINSSIRRSLRVLAERPALFQSSLDVFAEARESTLSDAFYTALTGSTSDYNHGVEAKPIEFHAHEPLRYIGDMLAWVHSATVSEREALEVLFISEGDEIAKGIQAGLDSEPWTRNSDAEVFDGMKALNELVGRDVAGVARMLRQRTEQVIQSHDDATLAYRIANLISFYKLTFSKLLSNESGFLGVLTGLEQSAFTRFQSSMQNHVRSIESELAVAPADLSTPDCLDEALDVLKNLMKSYDSSIAVTAVDNASFDVVLADALDPFLSACGNICRRLEEPGNDIFAINCLQATVTTLSPYPFTAERVSVLRSRIQEHIASLSKFQHRFFLHSSGLFPLVMALTSQEDAEEQEHKTPSLHSLQPFKAQSLIMTSQTLDDFLPSALMDASGNLKQLRDKRLAQDITEEAAEKFTEDFEFVENKIIEADESTENIDEESAPPLYRDLFPRTSAEIRVLLS